MTRQIEITPASSVYVGSATELLPRLLPDSNVIVVTDSNIEHNHPELILPYKHIVINPGEISKSLATIEHICSRLVEMGADRTTFIVGIGGGVVTDIAGFVAAIYMRGIRCGYVSTSLLGMVDASVGGKNGVNIGGYKNMVGTFRQPEFVVCDIALLSTLPDREFRSGIAEIIKTAIISDTELFGQLERNNIISLRNNTSLLAHIVERAIALKAHVVVQDECEAGLRRILNFGHTLAHAIEKSCPNYNHGEAVAMGMYHMSLVAERRGRLAAAECSRICRLIEQYGFTTTLPSDTKSLLDIVRTDKKRAGQTLHIILPSSIGSVEVQSIDIDNLNKELEL